jgi:uncharacterized protein YPO0396
MLNAILPVRSLLLAIFMLMAGGGFMNTLVSVRLERADTAGRVRLQLREERAKEWLNKYGKSCPLDQIEFILMNQAVWLGTSNTPAISSSIETIYKLKKASSDDLEKAVDKPRGSPANKK